MRILKEVNKLKLLSYQFENWLYQPAKIFFICFIVLITSLLANKTIWTLWGLYQDESRFKTEIVNSKKEAEKLDKQMVIAKDPQYIEQLAKDKMDLVGENDLIFIFPN